MSNLGSQNWYAGYEAPLGAEALAVKPNRILRLAPVADDIDFGTERPLITCSGDELVDLARNGLDRSWPAIEMPTLAFDEAQHRRERVLQPIKEAFEAAGRVPIDWLSGARAAILSTDLKPGPVASLSAVYFVLVDGFTAANGTYGVYVGSTSTIERVSGSQQAGRISQHFSGVKAAASVKNRGIEPLWSLNVFTRHIRATVKRDVEDAAHHALEATVPRVLGDVQGT